MFGLLQEPINYCSYGLSFLLVVFIWPKKSQFVLFLSSYILKRLISEFVFQDGVRFYIYFDSDYELDADSVEEKNKVGINLVFDWKALTLQPCSNIVTTRSGTLDGLHVISICELTINRFKCMD